MDPVTRKEMFLAKAGGQSVATPEPITREEIFLQRIAENGGSGGGSGGTSINHKRYVIEYAASDLTPTDDGTGDSFVASEEKQAEVLNLLAELSALTTITINVSVAVPMIGEIMRLPAFFDVKNEANGTNGNLSVVSYDGIHRHWNDDSDRPRSPVFGAISIYKKGMSVLPPKYYQAIGAMGAVITIDVLHL